MSAEMRNELDDRSDDNIYREKCKDLKRRITEVESNNEVATLALSRTKAVIRRLRLEYVVLLERLEERAIHIPNGINAFEEMASPPAALVLEESSNKSISKISRNGISKKIKKSKSNPLSNSQGGSKNQKTRDPDLPKRPTNAYLIFCDIEKDRIKQENEEKNPGANNDLSKSMTEAWKNLGDEDRKPYYKLYEDDRIRYQTEMLAYNQKKQFINVDIDDKKQIKKQRLDSDLAGPEDEKVDESIENAEEASSSFSKSNVTDVNTFAAKDGEPESKLLQGNNGDIAGKNNTDGKTQYAGSVPIASEEGVTNSEIEKRDDGKEATMSAETQTNTE